jgi:hypothetical protein
MKSDCQIKEPKRGRLRLKPAHKTIHTTVGDVVAVLTDEAFRVCRDSRQAYALAALALDAVLDRRADWKSREKVLLTETLSKTTA